MTRDRTAVPALAPAAVLASLLLGAIVAGTAPAQDMFDAVARVLERRYHDRAFRAEVLPGLIERYRPAAAAAAADEALERAVIHGFLAQIPASHLTLYSETTWQSLMRELGGRRQPTFGFSLVRLGARFFVAAVFEGGPAERAGLLAGDRVLGLDGEAPGPCARLDWRSDDAYLDDPPVHVLHCDGPGDRLRVEVERSPGAPAQAVVVEAREYSGLAAAEHSARVIERNGRRFGFVHFWFVHHGGCASMLRELLRDRFRDCDGLLLDLRGRGGDAQEAQAILRVLEDARDGGLEIVALIDGGTRSAKEILAGGIRTREIGTLCGEHTAGAVLPATFVRLPEHGAVLMLPVALRLGVDLEGKGVAPDVAVDAPGPYAAGRDPILDAAVELLARPRAQRKAAGR